MREMGWTYWELKATPELVVDEIREFIHTENVVANEKREEQQRRGRRR